LLVEARSRVLHFRNSDSCLQVHVHSHTLEEEAVYATGGKHLNTESLICRSTELAHLRIPRLLQCAERSNQQAELAHHEPGAERPLFPLHRGTERDTLGL